MRIDSAVEAELRQELDHPQTHPDKADHLTVGIDGAFVKPKRDGRWRGVIVRCSQGASNKSVVEARQSRSCAIWTDLRNQRCRLPCRVLDAPLNSPSRFYRAERMGCEAWWVDSAVKTANSQLQIDRVFAFEVIKFASDGGDWTYTDLLPPF
jgi:hypothetical protein